MNPASLHLLLNHMPTIGFAIGLAFFAVALLNKQAGLRRACLILFFVTAALSIATYVTGNDARESLKEAPGISLPMMEAHETAALGAFALMEITGFLAWIALWLEVRSARFASWNDRLILLIGAFTFVMMSRAAYVGGAIRHPETGAAETIPLDPSVPTLARTWGVFNQDHSWVWPACETLHFVGLCMLLGVVLAINLRLLGIGKTVLSSAALKQLLPFGMLGFALNLVTGMMFFVATPEQYTGQLFLLKMVLIIAGAINLLWFQLSSSGALKDGDNATIGAKLVAISSIVAWMAVIFCGHMLPWLGNSF